MTLVCLYAPVINSPGNNIPYIHYIIQHWYTLTKTKYEEEHLTPNFQNKHTLVYIIQKDTYKYTLQNIKTVTAEVQILVIHVTQIREHFGYCPIPDGVILQRRRLSLGWYREFFAVCMPPIWGIWVNASRQSDMNYEKKTSRPNGSEIALYGI